MTHPQTTVELDERLPIVRLSRDFDAPVARVYRAHAEPELFARWIGPRRLSTRIETWDLRTGGAWRFVQTDEDGNEYEFFGSFHEVRPEVLLVQTFAYTDFPDSVSLERLSLEDLGDGRTRLRAVSLVDSFEARAAMVEHGMEQGIVEGYEKLDEVLAGEDA